MCDIIHQGQITRRLGGESTMHCFGSVLYYKKRKSRKGSEESEPMGVIKGNKFSCTAQERDEKKKEEKLMKKDKMK